MLFFLDSANVEELLALMDTGLIDGVTTNPSLIAKSGKKIDDVIALFCEKTQGPVSVEVMAHEAKDMIKEGKNFAKIADNITIKLPLTMEGLKACFALSQEEIMTNVTLCFSATQALMAAKAGATFVSPFVGRLDDIGQEGMTLIQDIAKIFEIHNLDTMILAASIRSPLHVMQAAKAGAHVATIPAKVIDQMVRHPLTDRGIEMFENDWKLAKK
ncbi:MAG: Transaldolase [Holosporales bacterium]